MSEYLRTLGAFTLLATLSIGCTNAKLYPLPDNPQPLSVQGMGQFCTQPPDISNQFTKFMFVIDSSGSNSHTDPNNKFRADNIETFWKKHNTDANIKWGYIEFGYKNDGDASAYINKGGDQNPIFSGLPADMQNALKLQRQNAAGNGTPYRAPIQLAKRAITNDILNNPKEDSNYVVLFITDGMPTDYTGNEDPPGAPAFADVDDLMSAAPGKVTFSTAFYGKYDSGTQAQIDIGLNGMAQHGHGKYINLLTTPDFKIEDLLVNGPSAATYKIKQMLVYNVNSAICFDKTWGVDSDGDGLCDKDEDMLTASGVGNFDKQNRFSFGDNYGDYFHYKALVTGGKLMPCTDPNGKTDEDHDLLTLCEEKLLHNAAPPNPQDAKFADPRNPDTDRDGFLDGIEYFTLHDLSSAVNSQNLLRSYTFPQDPDWAGFQILQHRNPTFFDASLGIDDIYDTDWQPTGYNTHHQTCYTFSQQHLRTYDTLPVTADKALSPEYAHPANGNIVLVYYIEVLETDPSSNGVYVYSLQNINSRGFSTDGSQANLIVNDQVFKTYVTP